MKSKNKLALTAFSLLAIAAVALTSIGIASADTQNGHRQPGQGKGPGPRNKAVVEAIENNDYEAFLEAASDWPQGAEEITEEQFAIIVQAHNLRKEGNDEEAKELMAEAGLNRKGRMGRGQGQRNGEQMKEVLESGSYEKFKSILEGDKVLELIDSEEKFNRLLEAHKLRKEADQIMEELGFERPNKRQGRDNN
ncbi:MAG: hypothetical protein GF347_01495 [Candidatus Moranbacteria bacterium]|nr:hypothetical protein [Candidatus Moranbacteria bacterium]